MELQAYIDSKAKVKPSADIIERWRSRVETRRLHALGTEGAEIYLRDYSGSKMAAPKCLGLAKHALNEGFYEFARVFFLKAAGLEGVTVSDAGNEGVPDMPILRTCGPEPERVVIDGLPAHIQPGRFVSMQPVDAQGPRDAYVNDPRYWAQGKVDGQKLILFVTADNVYAQSRSLKLSAAPFDQRINDALMKHAGTYGSFVVEGELVFLDVNRGEHRTGSQASTVNVELGHSLRVPDMRYVVFCKVADANYAMNSYGEHVEEGHKVVNAINSPAIVMAATYKSKAEKKLLCDTQQAQGREGEIFFLRDMPYHAGKVNDDSIIRCKYLAEFEATVVGFTPTTAEGHAFGALMITDLAGRSLGNVGTGFTREDKQMLCNKFAATGPFKVPVRAQGFTENGIAWHARFDREEWEARYV